MKTLIIIPAYNEELNIENTINKLKKYWRKLWKNKNRKY